MKRIAPFLCAPHVTRMLVIMVAGIIIYPVLSIGTQAQTVLNESIESFVASEQKTHISSGIVNFSYALENQLREYQYPSSPSDDPSKLKSENLEEGPTDELKQPLP